MPKVMHGLCPDVFVNVLGFQPAAPQPSSSALADLLMVDTTPSQPAATGIMSLTSSNTLTFCEIGLLLLSYQELAEKIWINFYAETTEMRMTPEMFSIV